jgi:hypothetical protein
MNRRGFLLASLLALPPLLGTLAVPHEAEAHTARILTLEDLVDRSAYVVIGTAGEHRSLWEDLPSGRRIVTYTKIAVERAVAGAPAGELWVRTLGGVVDKIGQAVPGEAQLLAGSRALLFLAQTSGALVVTAMSQGHYPVVLDAKGVARLGKSPDVGMLIARPGPVVAAHERLVGASVDDAVTLVAQIRKARDAKK